METQVWTDGSFSPRTRRGGWAWVSRTGWNAGACENGVSSEAMELRAILEALRNNPGPLVIYTDHIASVGKFSQDQLRLREWLAGARRDRTSLEHGLRVLIHDELADRQVRFQHVRGHSGDRYNERADRLAKNARLSI